MKRLTLVAVLVVGLGITASSASAAPATSNAVTPAQFAALSTKVKNLQKTVTSQAKTITTLRNEIAANFVGDACITATTGDLLQWSWLTVNKGSNFPNFPSTSTAPPIPDNDACKAIGVTRPVASSDTPPTLSVFSAIIKWLIG